MTIKEMVQKELKACKAPNVTVIRLIGLTTGIPTTVQTTSLALGDCTGEELEAIKQMRQNMEMKYHIHLINVKIDL